jgi:hypothetical protein
VRGYVRLSGGWLTKREDEAPGALRGVEKTKISCNESQHYKGMQKLPTLGTEDLLMSQNTSETLSKVVVRVEERKSNLHPS